MEKQNIESKEVNANREPIVIKQKSVAGVVALILSMLAILGTAYNFYSGRTTLSLDRERTQKMIDEANRKVSTMAEQIKVDENSLMRLRSTMKVLYDDLESSLKKNVNRLVDRIKRVTDQNQTAQQQLQTQVAQKADSSEVSTLREATMANTSDIGLLKNELGETRRVSEAARQDLNSFQDFVQQDLAQSKEDIASLKIKGDSIQNEFVVRKNAGFQRVGDIYVAFRNADPKKHQYDIALRVNDYVVERKDRVVNEPIQLLVGKSKARYELVVSEVGKDRLVGYVNIPKDKPVATERLALY